MACLVRMTMRDSQPLVEQAAAAFARGEIVVVTDDDDRENEGDLFVAAALMGINAVKGVEIGAGFAAAALSGEANADEMRMRDGAVIEVVAEGVPVGLGSPVYGKLDGDLAAALMWINAVKGVEIGDGFATAALTGGENADEIRMGNDGRPRFLSNHAGGILGGISTGQPIVARFAVKPTSSILNPRRTVDRYGRETEIVTKGRHDPCVGIRAVPIGEAMVACVVADHYLRHRGQVGTSVTWPFAKP